MNQTDITYAEAKAYAFANPRLSADQLRERFQTISPEHSRKLMWRSRTAARKAGIEIQRNPGGIRNPVYSLAKEYAYANPTLTPTQLRQLFPLETQQSHKLMSMARVAAGVKPTPLPPPEERQPTQKQAAILAEAAQRRADAIAYALANPNVYVTQISKMFRVRTVELTAARDNERNRRKREEAAKPKALRRRLFAVMPDGSMVDPQKRRSVDDAIGFKEVMV